MTDEFGATACLPYTSALYVCLICLPYMSALHVCRIMTMTGEFGATAARDKRRPGSLPGPGALT